MSLYILRQEDTFTYRPLLNAVSFDAHSPAQANLRGALLSYILLNCRDVPDLSDLKVAENNAGADIPHIAEDFILPIEECLLRLFEEM